MNHSASRDENLALEQDDLQREEPHHRHGRLWYVFESHDPEYP